MEPVEIDIRMKQNVSEEGKKATDSIGEMDEASKALHKALMEKLEAQKKLISEIEGNIKKATKGINRAVGDEKETLVKYRAALQDALGDTKKYVSELEGTIKSGSGSVNDLVEASEGLKFTQTELNDLLSDSTSLQDAANRMLSISKGKIDSLTSSKKLLAAANQWVAKTFNISETAAKRFTAVASFGLSIAIAGLIKLWERYKEKQEEINRRKQEFIDIEVDATRAMASEKTKIEQLHRIANDHNKSLNVRNKAIKQLNSIMPDYNGYIDVEGRLIDNADTAVKNHITSLYKLEKARKLLAKMDDVDVQIAEEQNKPVKAPTFFQKVGAALAAGGDRSGATTYQSEIELIKRNNQKAKDDVIQDLENKKKEFNDEFDKLISDESIYDALFGGKKNKGSRSQAAKKEYDAQSELAKQLVELRARTAELQIETMQDGFDKKIAQINHEEKEELKRIEDYQKKIVDAYNKENKTSHTDIKNIPGIKPEMLAEIEAEKTKISAAAEKQRKQATADNAKEIADLARKYASERVKVEYDYQQDIDRLKAAGNMEAAKAAEMERNKRISEITTEMIESSSIYKLATDEKIQASKEATEALVSDIKKRIELLVLENKLTREAADRMLGDINKTQVSRENSKSENNPFAKLISGLNKYKAAKKELDDKRDSLSPEQFVKLEDAANKALKSTAEASAEALAGVQAILGSVVGALDQLGALTEEEKQTANEVVGMVGGAAELAMGIASGNPIGIITGAVNLLTSAISFFDFKSKRIAKQQKEHKKNLEELGRAYNNLQREVDKALGTDVYKKQKDAIKNLQKQIAENERLIALENQKKKKKRDQKAIAAWKSEIDALKGEIGDTIQSITEDLAQTNAKTLAQQLAGALVDAARTGEDAFTAMGDVVNDVLRNAVVNSLSKKFLEKQMGEATDFLASAMEDGSLDDYEKRRFEQMIRNAGESFNTAMKAYNELFAADEADPDHERHSAAKGIAQASQDSIDALSGTITYMAGEFRTANVLAAARTESVKDTQVSVHAMLAVLNTIAENTAYCKRLEDVAESLERINRDGINIKK